MESCGKVLEGALSQGSKLALGSTGPYATLVRFYMAKVKVVLAVM